jgi:hypothetical protein
MAVLGVAIGVNQLIGETPAGPQLNGLANRFTELSNKSKANSAT